jgi:hypothetical protein
MRNCFLQVPSSWEAQCRLACSTPNHCRPESNVRPRRTQHPRELLYTKWLEDFASHHPLIDRYVTQGYQPNHLAMILSEACLQGADLGVLSSASQFLWQSG